MNHFHQHLAAGQALMRAHNFHGAIARFKEALALSPNNEQALALLAGCQMDLGQLKEAKATAEAGLAAAPDYPPLQRTLGAIVGQQGDTIAAEKHLRRAIELNPNDPMSYAVWANILTRYGRHGPAVEALEKAMALAPDDFRVLSSAANTYLNATRYDDAERAARRAYALAPGEPSVLVVNGFVDLRRGRIESAESFAQLAASTVAFYRPVLSLFAQVQMAKSRWLRPIWFAMNWLLSISPDTRVIVFFILYAFTPVAFAFPPAPYHWIAGGLMVAVTLAFMLTLRLGDSIVRSMVARTSRAAQLKREY